jgi:hypothetical protein
MGAELIFRSNGKSATKSSNVMIDGYLAMRKAIRVFFPLGTNKKF